ncbi:unnamed protein product [Rhodiola kirilowii]
MAPSVSLTLCVFLVLAHGCLGFSGFQPFQSFGPWSAGSGWQGQQRHRPLRSMSECKLDSFDALEPKTPIRAEGGTIEYWNNDDQQFQCAGINAVRHVIEPKGLLLPSFSNSPQLSYIVEGRGVIGAVFPGCPESFQSGSSQGSSQRGEHGRESQRGEHGRESQWGEHGRRESQRGRGQHQTGKINDQHQKIRNFRQGDIIALPAGVAHWIYNDGQTPIVAVTIFDTSNDANQLDQSIRKFFLAGSSQTQQGQGRKEMRGRQEGTRGQQIKGQGQGEQSQNWQSIFSGFNEELLADVFNVNQDLIRSIQGQNEQRGSIILVQEPLEFLTPTREEEERSQGSSHEHGRWVDVNMGLRETFCNVRLIQNIGDPIQADLFNPRGGRITTLNSQKLPILNFLQLSAERGVLYKNALLAPKYEMNSHSIIYITRGSSRIQMVNERGQNVFDGKVQEGQLLIVPQNYVILKQAGNEGCEWVAFKTIDNAMVSPLSGRVSVFRGLPEEVLMNSYGISREDAKSLKFNKEEMLVFGPGSRQGREFEE